MNMPITFAGAECVDINFDDAADGPATPDALSDAGAYELLDELTTRLNETNGADFIPDAAMHDLIARLQAEVRRRGA